MSSHCSALLLDIIVQEVERAPCRSRCVSPLPPHTFSTVILFFLLDLSVCVFVWPLFPRGRTCVWEFPHAPHNNFSRLSLLVEEEVCENDVVDLLALRRCRNWFAKFGFPVRSRYKLLVFWYFSCQRLSSSGHLQDIELTNDLLLEYKNKIRCLLTLSLSHTHIFPFTAIIIREARNWANISQQQQ